MATFPWPETVPGYGHVKRMAGPSAITPVWLEKPERIAALAMLTVVGLLVSMLIQASESST